MLLGDRGSCSGCSCFNSHETSQNAPAVGPLSPPILGYSVMVGVTVPPLPVPLFTRVHSNLHKCQSSRWGGEGCGVLCAMLRLFLDS